jgi:hypothetical protein
METKPVIHAIIARDLGNGHVTRTWVVPLSTAFLAVKSGRWIAVGPCPIDQANLATWERQNQPVINRPRWQR